MSESTLTENERLNTAVYKKIFAEQEAFHEWLREQTLDTIFEHVYEYNVKQDIVLAMEYNDLSDDQCRALLKRKDLLDELFHEFEHHEFGYMDHVFDMISLRADKILAREKEQEER